MYPVMGKTYLHRNILVVCGSIANFTIPVHSPCPKCTVRFDSLWGNVRSSANHTHPITIGTYLYREIIVLVI